MATHNVNIEGSHGSIVADFATGAVIRADACDCADCARHGDYRSILFFDPLGFDECAREHGQTDILYVSAIYADGSYCRAMGPASEQRARDAQPFDASDDVHLLPDLRGEC